MPSDEVELVLDARASVGEGPLWDPDEGLLYWVDIEGQALHCYDPVRRRDRAIDVGQPVGALALREVGGLMLAVRDGFAEIDLSTGTIDMVALVEADQPRNRMNDGRCDAGGRFWAGTMALDITPGKGSLYRLDPDRRVTRMLEDVTISNGIDWSDDNQTMYYVDSGTQALEAFDFDCDKGSIRNRRTVARIPVEAGMPDGLVLDGEGYIWVALWGGSALRRYRPDGTLERVVRLPVSQVTACAFAGPDLMDLYITSATSGLSSERAMHEPTAGGLFLHRPGVAGRPPRKYSG